MLSPAIPICLAVVPAYIIACKSEQHIFELHPALYIIAFGLVVAKVTNRLVVSLCPKLRRKNRLLVFKSIFQVAHMTRSEMDYLDSVLIGPALLFLNQYFNTFFQEYHVLWVCLVRKLIQQV